MNSDYRDTQWSTKARGVLIKAYIIAIAAWSATEPRRSFLSEENWNIRIEGRTGKGGFGRMVDETII